MVPHGVAIDRGGGRHGATAGDGAWLLQPGNNSSILILPREMGKEK